MFLLILSSLQQFCRVKMQWIVHTKMRMTVWCTSSIMRMKVANLSCLWTKSQVVLQLACMSDILLNWPNICVWPATKTGRQNVLPTGDSFMFFLNTSRALQTQRIIWEFRNVLFTAHIKMHSEVFGLLRKCRISHIIISLSTCLVSQSVL